MKRRIMLQTIETMQTRIEDTYKASENDPCVDAYAMQKQLIQELIELLKSNTDALIDMQLIHWIDRQQHVGKEASDKVNAQNIIKDLDSILEKEQLKGQMSIYDL